MMLIGKMRAHDPNLVDPWTKPTGKSNFYFAKKFRKVCWSVPFFTCEMR
jgi:hypothetical protein